ncbi:haloacid dehalogenase [Hortaea werneckii]|uniref:Haloacid dehalogenase, type II n=2 Tax=Hortaea werneckii TaxID=91943 RepID=A0A1Z5TTB4_HORWE|nr:haloacid dehalogenase [Hortaea werneckii]OTA39229.1 hypothetical protein BTJ68_00883 [Hortaea werneckii EXF-2000]KAI6802915.1 haloacid dehalogenase [Hortaea werneckii]KAI6903746.1 haloacid dehalogenase [Hortaea werneckii]KAI6922372.1 haloacid dehalogenase [Hortaea werneckii]
MDEDDAFSRRGDAVENQHPASDGKQVHFGSPTPLPKRDLERASRDRTARGALSPLGSKDMALKDPQPRCLFFDVFGTCVNWRKTVTDTLWAETRKALSSPASSIASRIRMTASDMTYDEWGGVAQEWRNGYLKFTRDIATDGNRAWKTVDEHHLESLREILTNRGLLFPRDDDTPVNLVHDGSLWDEQQIRDISIVWHRLDPWPDTVRGIQELNRLFWTCTLSNGNLALLKDMVEHAGMEFSHVFSAEMFKSYKPNPAVYLGAAEKMGLRSDECCMVAAHLDDLKAAKANGFRTIYVERAMEERHPELKEERFVDIWVGINEEGFVAAAEKLGCQILRARRRSGSAPQLLKQEE